MTQEPLFLESIYDALRAIVEHSGGAKVVGHRLFPSKSPEDSRVALLNALSPARPEKLDPEQVIHLLSIGREAGFHAAKHWLDAETGYVPTDPADPDTERAELARVIEGAAQTMERAMSALKRIDTKRSRA